jgi:hypothetical protein
VRKSNSQVAASINKEVEQARVQADSADKEKGKVDTGDTR